MDELIGSRFLRSGLLRMISRTFSRAGINGGGALLTVGEMVGGGRIITSITRSL